MRKYFLVITLFALLFLGLGNYSFAQTQTYDQCILNVQSICEQRVLSQAACDYKKNYECSSLQTTNSEQTTNSDNCILGSTDSNCADQISSSTTTTNPSNCTQNSNCTVAGYTCDLSELSPTKGTCIVSAPNVGPSNAPAGTPCTNPPKDNAHINTFGICVCDVGYKNINKVCTPCSDPGVCCGISLNTSIPFIGKCIEDDSKNRGSDETSVSGETAFPVLMGSLVKILVTVILILSFVLIIIGGIMIATGNPAEGRKMIIKVVIGIALLGASGVILRLINPNFFG